VAAVLLPLEHVDASQSAIRASLATLLAKVGLLVRFGPMTARAYATLVRVIVAERLWVVGGLSVRSRKRELT
jgi:hypothetical protein